MESALHDLPKYVIEERELTHILKSVLAQKLRITSLIVSDGPLMESSNWSFLEYMGRFDLCIYGNHLTQALQS